jgi:hypothetical protein
MSSKPATRPPGGRIDPEDGPKGPRTTTQLRKKLKELFSKFEDSRRFRDAVFEAVDDFFEYPTRKRIFNRWKAENKPKKVVRQPKTTPPTVPLSERGQRVFQALASPIAQRSLTMVSIFLRHVHDLSAMEDDEIKQVASMLHKKNSIAQRELEALPPKDLRTYYLTSLSLDARNDMKQFSTMIAKLNYDDLAKLIIYLRRAGYSTLVAIIKKYLADQR